MRGTLPLKVRIPGCAPIRKASGTHDKKMRRKLISMVHTLHEQGRDDLVNAIAAGRLKPLQVYTRFRFNRLEELPHADELPLFRDTWPQWLAKKECSETHRQNTRYYFERFDLRIGDGSLGAIVDVLKEYRAEMHGHARAFNLAKSDVQAFLRAVLGRRHRVYMDASDIPTLKVRPTQKKHPLTADQLRVLVKDLGDPWGPIAWTMATTGMGWKEFTGDWEREGVGLRIHGTKTGGRDRLVPLVSLLHRPIDAAETTFRYHLDKATPRVTPYDLRRTYTGIMVDAHIPRPRRKLYLGHSAEDITALYERQEVEEYLVKDAEAMRRVIGEPEGGPLLRVLRA